MRSRNRMANKTTKYAIFLTISILLLSGSMIYYINYKMGVIRHDYDTKISELNADLIDKLKYLKTSLEEQLALLDENLSMQIGGISDNLEDFKRQNQLQINALSSLIDQIEQQSSIRLNELKSELKDIQIKSADFSAIVDDVLQSVVSVKTNLAQGSGAIIDTKGYVVTNLHVISGASSIRVATYSDRTYNAVLVGYDGTYDIAVLKIDVADLQVLNFGDSDDVKIGEKVLAAGNPAGLAFTVTEGIVSAFRKLQNNVDYIQTDVPINPGNSGGPLVNAKGEIIGINNFKVGGFEGLGFAISSNDVSAVANKIISEYESKQNQ